mmetsp:Transcript_46054/g.107629  ORF Transcript_46054/g.107629 Transcript_46054/m.107629 type:complete len:249 (-) Transcript_46054:231-977(-)
MSLSRHQSRQPCCGRIRQLHQPHRRCRCQGQLTGREVQQRMRTHGQYRKASGKPPRALLHGRKASESEEERAGPVEGVRPHSIFRRLKPKPKRQRLRKVAGAPLPKCPLAQLEANSPGRCPVQQLRRPETRRVRRQRSGFRQLGPLPRPKGTVLEAWERAEVLQAFGRSLHTTALPTHVVDLQRRRWTASCGDPVQVVLPVVDHLQFSLEILQNHLPEFLKGHSPQTGHCVVGAIRVSKSAFGSLTRA